MLRLWEVLGEGEIWHIADYAAEFFNKHHRPLRIAVDEAGWRFKNLNAHQVEAIRESESAANPIEKVILQRIYRLLRLNIQLIFVDDGLRRPWKRGKSGGGKLDYELKKLTRQTLAQLKVPHHEAPGEAEAECARMQALGIVDAVWSDDGDSFMFGCEILIKQHKQGSKIVKDHVRIYRAEDIRHKHDMDRESLVLFALLAGGDYETKGLPGCGPKTAARVAKRQTGLAWAICHAAKSDLPKWRQDLQRALHGKTDVPWDFPDFKALGNYRNPNISTDEQLRDLRGVRNGWDRQIDQQNLRLFLRHMFNFTTREYLKHIAPILVARRLARVLPENSAENVELGIQLKRTRKIKVKEGEEDPPAKSEVKIWFSPISIVEIDLMSCPPEEDWTKFAAKDGTPYDPTRPVECEMLECFLKHGLPKDALVEAPPPTRGRKRKTDATQEDKEDSPSKKKRKSPQHKSQQSPGNAEGKKRGKPREDPTANSAKEKSKPKKKKKRKDSEAQVTRPSSPPPATFQLPKGLAELKAKARVVLLCDDEDSASDEPYDSDEDLARATQLSLREYAVPSSSKETSGSKPLSIHDDVAASSRSLNRQGLRASSFLDGATPGGIDVFEPVPQLAFPTPAHLDVTTTTAKQTLVPGQTISAQALRELRAGSSLLKGAISHPLVSPEPSMERHTNDSAKKRPEVIDLT